MGHVDTLQRDHEIGKLGSDFFLLNIEKPQKFKDE